MTKRTPTRKRPIGSAGWLDDEIALARRCWGSQIGTDLEEELRALLARTGLRVRLHEIQLLDGRLYVNHAGLLRIARRHRCAGIETEVVQSLSRPSSSRWVVRATVFKKPGSLRGFTGWGDADPATVSSQVRGAELRVAETRAVNRAIRKAYAIGVCSAEEIAATAEDDLALAAVPGVEGSVSEVRTPAPQKVLERDRVSLQDRLKLLFRDYQLDPAQVLQYGLRFLGVKQIGDATPGELQRFVTHLEELAVVNRVWLLGELARCPQPTEESPTNPAQTSAEGDPADASRNEAPLREAA